MFLVFDSGFKCVPVFEVLGLGKRERTHLTNQIMESQHMILDGGMFLNRLKTKAEENGKMIIEANQWFASSKTCNYCGYVNKDLTIEDREWTCPKCGSKLMRDVNAA